MPLDPLHALHASQRPGRHAAGTVGGTAVPTALVAGATGSLGSEMLRRLVGAQRLGLTRVLAREPLQSGLRGVQPLVVPGDDPTHWPPPPGAVDLGLVMFDPPRLYYGRERALWTPTAAQLGPVAAWMRAAGARTLVVVLPHAQGSLPEAVKRGFASLDEQAVASLGFERLLIVRSAQKPRLPRADHPASRLAAWLLASLHYMVPSSEQPVRPAKLAELVDWALQLAPAGIHVAAPELVWRAAQGDVRDIVAQWLGRSVPA